MSDRLRIPGSRDIRATLDDPDDADAIVVACPPHPQMGGSRTDSRLTAVGDALAEHGIGCLRFDYGPWDEGRGEVTDAVAACRWARDRSDRVGLFGYSFGGGVALLAALEIDPWAVALLAPHAGVGEHDAASAVAELDCPLQVVYGERDDTADWQAIVEAARTRGATVEAMAADHFFVGQRVRAAETVATWLASHL
ncbi:MAG: alpha/beta hydrolase [Halapricum sp.]